MNGGNDVNLTYKLAKLSFLSDPNNITTPDWASMTSSTTETVNGQQIYKYELALSESADRSGGTASVTVVPGGEMYTTYTFTGTPPIKVTLNTIGNYLQQHGLQVGNNDYGTGETLMLEMLKKFDQLFHQPTGSTSTTPSPSTSPSPTPSPSSSGGSFSTL